MERGFLLAPMQTPSMARRMKCWIQFEAESIGPLTYTFAVETVKGFVVYVLILKSLVQIAMIVLWMLLWEYAGEPSGLQLTLLGDISRVRSSSLFGVLVEVVDEHGNVFDINQDIQQYEVLAKLQVMVRFVSESVS